MGQAVREKGVQGTELPPYSPLCITVPGAAALWEDLIKEHGSKSMQEVNGHTCPSHGPSLIVMTTVY